MIHRYVICVLLGLAGVAHAADAPVTGVVVSPASLDLRHARQPHSIQVLGATADGYTVDLRPQAKITSANPQIAAVDERGWVRPVATGTTEVSVAVNGQTHKVPVKVTLPAAEPPMSFRHEVMPVLTKGGCNAGACHGYSLGK